MTGRIKIPCDTSNVNLIKMTSPYAHSTFICLDQRLFFWQNERELAGWFNGESSVFKSL